MIVSSSLLFDVGRVVVWEDISESLPFEAERSVLSLCLATTLILLTTTALSFRADGRSGSCVLGSKEDMVLVHCATKKHRTPNN